MPTEPWTFPVWERIAKAGKVTKCHAGEFDGAGPRARGDRAARRPRVQHGVRAIEDPAVVKLAADEGVTFDICPLSNVGLKVYPRIASHPLRELMKAGINCTVSTDDPLCFANTVSDEYTALAAEGGLHAGRARPGRRNGWKVADVPEADKRRNGLAEIDRLPPRERP
jgi:adenosine deaminase